MKRTLKNFYHTNCDASEKIYGGKRKRRNDLAWLSHFGLMAVMVLLTVTGLHAQAVSPPWDAASATASGYTNWGGGVISLTDTTTNSGSCQGAAVLETSSTYTAVNSGAVFNQCYRVFFGCPGNDNIAPNSTTYTDQNGDGMAFSFYKNGTAYNVNNGLACGGGLGYMGAVGGVGAAGTMITIEFDTYSSVGGSGFDVNYGGGGGGTVAAGQPGDELSVHVNGDASDAGILPVAGASVAPGNLEDGLEHDVCITYTPGVNDGVLTVTIDGIPRLSISLGATYNLQTYFGGSALNQSWSGGKYGANNLQTVGPAGSNLFATIGSNPCTGVIIMPVTLLTFSGEMNSGAVDLSWVTTTEKSNGKFIIERSHDLSGWEAIGEVAGAGNSNTVLIYSFTDYAPLNCTSYYRLRQVDIDGTYAYSKIVSVQTDRHYINIAPNPFDKTFTIRSDVSGNMAITIRDVLGKVVYHVNQESENGILNIQPELSPGAYIITIQTEAFIEQQKIIRK